MKAPPGWGGAVFKMGEGGGPQNEGGSQMGGVSSAPPAPNQTHSAISTHSPLFPYNSKGGGGPHIGVGGGGGHTLEFGGGSPKFEGGS